MAATEGGHAHVITDGLVGREQKMLPLLGFLCKSRREAEFPTEILMRLGSEYVDAHLGRCHFQGCGRRHARKEWDRNGLCFFLFCNISSLFSFRHATCNVQGVHVCSSFAACVAAMIRTYDWIQLRKGLSVDIANAAASEASDRTELLFWRGV